MLCAMTQHYNLEVAALIERATALAKATGLAETTIANRALSCGLGLEKLRRGRRIWPETIQKAHRRLDLIQAAHDKKRSRKGAQEPAP